MDFFGARSTNIRSYENKINKITIIICTSYVSFPSGYLPNLSCNELHVLLTKHYEIWRISMKSFLVQIFGVKFDISTSTVNILFMFYCELNNKLFSCIAKWFLEHGRNSIELCILRGLDSFKKQQYICI